MLTKLRGLSITSWNYVGQDAKQFRHYGPVAQDFFAVFGHDVPRPSPGTIQDDFRGAHCAGIDRMGIPGAATASPS